MTNPNPSPDHPSRARDIFLEVIDLSAAERPLALDRLCADAPGLRAEAEALLRAAEHASADDFMASPTAWTLTSRREQISEGPGSVIGPYKLLQFIGEGGFGVVFLAEQQAPVRRKVALKIIKPGMDSKAVVARFEAERQALALMNHPHIARVYDGGITDPAPTGAGRPYFVMEYVVGDPITKFADAHKLDLRARLELLTQVCQAVQHAHTKGLIHRDLKPANVLVSMVDGKPFAKVIDFGIAKSLASPLTEKTLFTEHRQLIGTPEYMSPEQAEGTPDIDTRTDVYALGVLLYELLTGLTPFDSRRLRSAAFEEMRRIIKDEDPPLPSQRISRSLPALAALADRRQVEPARLGALLQGELDWIVMKSLEKDRSRRYETPNQLAADMQRYLTGEAVVAAPPSAGYRLRKFVRRHKAMVTGGTAVGVALLLGMAGTAWGMWNAKVAQRGLRTQVDAAVDALGRVLAAASPELGVQDLELLEGGTLQFRDSDGNTHQNMISNDGQPVDAPAIAWLSGLAMDAIEGNRTVNERLSAQTDAATETLSQMFLLGTETPGGMDAGLPVIPEIRGEPGYRLWASLRGDGSPENPYRFEFGKFDAARRTLHKLDKDKVLPLLADTAMGTLRKALELADAAEWSAYTANLALAQLAIDGMDYPEARSRLRNLPPSKLGWEGELLLAEANSILWATDIGGFFLGVSADSRLVQLQWSSDYPVMVYDADTGDLLSEGKAIPSVAAYSARLNGTSVEVEPASDRCELWDPIAGHLLRALAPDAFRATYSPDGLRVITSNTDGLAGEGLQVRRTDAFGAPMQRWFTGPVTALRLQAMLGSGSAAPIEGLSITTPDGERRIIGSVDGTVRFVDAATEREVAVFRLESAVQNLQMTGDGTRLVVSTKDDRCYVWDIREPQSRRGDLERELAEYHPAEIYLDALMDGSTPTGDLLAAVTTDPSISPLRRWVAAELLDARMDEMRHAATRAFKTVTQGQTDKAAVLEAARAADLPPRVKASVIAQVAEWEYTPPTPSAKEKLAEETKRRRLAEAAAAIAESASREMQPLGMADRVSQAVKDRVEILGRTHPLTLEARLELSRYAADERERARAWAELKYRGGDFESAAAWIEDKEGVRAPHPAESALLAMCSFKLGRLDVALEALAKARALMAPAADGTPSPWANDLDAQALLAEADQLLKAAEPAAQDDR